MGLASSTALRKSYLSVVSPNLGIVAVVGRSLALRASVYKGLAPGPFRGSGAKQLSVLWRCPTLPHPPRCSTIGACGLSFQVRNGGWAFPRGYDHHKMVQPVFTSLCPQRVGVCVGCDPYSGDEHSVVSVNPMRLAFVVEVFVSVGPLVPVGSRAPRGASTSGLSTR